MPAAVWSGPMTTVALLGLGEVGRVLAEELATERTHHRLGHGLR